MVPQNIDKQSGINHISNTEQNMSKVYQHNISHPADTTSMDIPLSCPHPGRSSDPSGQRDRLMRRWCWSGIRVWAVSLVPSPSEHCDLTELTDSYRSTEVSSSSRSKLESPLHGNTLGWGWTPGGWETSSSWSVSLLLSTESWMVGAANRFLVWERITLRNSDGWGWAADTGEGTDLAGSNIFRCNVRGRPFPSSWRTV